MTTTDPQSTPSLTPSQLSRLAADFRQAASHPFECECEECVEFWTPEEDE